MGSSTRPRDREMDNLVADLCNGEVPLFITGAGYALPRQCPFILCWCRLWPKHLPTKRDFSSLLALIDISRVVPA
jgi:hypothetical protein